jgi:hypothetical protein
MWDDGQVFEWPEPILDHWEMRRLADAARYLFERRSRNHRRLRPGNIMRKKLRRL